jgi:predicted NUDIX family NTP pyrophosphohydrolase
MRAGQIGARETRAIQTCPAGRRRYKHAGVANMKSSAGLLIYRFRDNVPEVFLIHPGGPFWKGKDVESWSIPKGEFVEPEEPLSAAQREFAEETGFQAQGPFQELTPVKQSNHKMVYAWAAPGEYDATKIQSNNFSMEWPPRSGKMEEFPEADRAEWFSISEAKKKIFKGQRPLLDELERILIAHAG